MRRQSRAAFTLIELIVVILIIAVLAALLIPAASHIRAGSLSTACLSNLRQIGVGLSSYLAENDQTMPTMLAGRTSLSEEAAVLDNTLDRYLANKAVFACPADGKFARASGTSYFWNSALNGQHLGSLSFLQLSESQSQIPVLSDKEGFHPYIENKVNILYADGHATKDLQFHTSK